MEFKSYDFELKRLSEVTGEFSGRLSVYNQIDQGGDLVEAGAFQKTILERGDRIPLLWQHKPDSPIGTLVLEDTATALMVKGKLLLDLPDAVKAYVLMKSGIVKGLSIGFRTIREKFVEGVRRLQEIKLYEGSVVTFPMLESALITDVKSRSARAKETELLRLISELRKEFRWERPRV